MPNWRRREAQKPWRQSLDAEKRERQVPLPCVPSQPGNQRRQRRGAINRNWGLMMADSQPLSGAPKAPNI